MVCSLTLPMYVCGARVKGRKEKNGECKRDQERMRVRREMKKKPEKEATETTKRYKNADY